MDNKSQQIEVRFPPHLRRFMQLPESHCVEGATARDIVDRLEQHFPGVANYLLHENGSMRQHVNIFLDDRLLRDRAGLSDRLDGIHQLTIMQALSGG